MLQDFLNPSCFQVPMEQIMNRNDVFIKIQQIYGDGSFRKLQNSSVIKFSQQNN